MCFAERGNCPPARLSVFLAFPPHDTSSEVFNSYYYSLKKVDKCPQCRVAISASSMARNLAIEQMAEKVNPIFICPKTISMGGNRQHKVNYLDYKKHTEEECIYRDVVCPLCKDNVKVPRREFEAHFQEKHSDDVLTAVSELALDRSTMIAFYSAISSDGLKDFQTSYFEVLSADGEIMAKFLCFAMMQHSYFTVCFFRFDFSKSGTGNKFAHNELYVECGNSLHKVKWMWLPDDGICKPHNWLKRISGTTESPRPTLPGFSCYPLAGMVGTCFLLDISLTSPW